jgi:hypothetical protein
MNTEANRQHARSPTVERPGIGPSGLAQHAAQNAMDDRGEIARFHDRCSDLMRELLEALAAVPDRPRTFPEIEDALGWPHRRIASVLGGVSHLRQTEFGGRRPYRFQDDRRSASARWEMWMDSTQARAVRAAQQTEPREDSIRHDRASEPQKTTPAAPWTFT